MGSSLGMSTGSSGVYSALVDTDSADATPGSLPAETRFVSADQVNTNVGDLVRASIKLMTTQVSDRAATPRSIGVTYSTDQQLASIRSSLAKSPSLVRLIPEPAAVHAYLAETGKTARYGTTAQIDLGDNGLSVSVIDHSGEVLVAERTEALAGAGIDRALVAFVTDKYPHPLGRHTDTELLVSRCHVAKEQLSTTRSVTIDLPRGPMTITRVEFEDIIAADLERAVTLIRSVLSAAPQPVEAIVLIGGGAHIPAVRTAIADAARVPVVEFDEPEAAAAKGAALLADSAVSLRYPLAGAETSERSRPAAKASGALIGALMVGGLVLGYAAKEFVPSDNTPISPVGTGSTTLNTTTDVVPTTGSTVIPSNDPVPTVEHSTIPYQPQPYVTQPYRTQPYETHQFTLSPAPPSNTSTPTTTVPPTTTTTTPVRPTLPGITLPDTPSWWPENLPQIPSGPTEIGPGEGGNAGSGATETTAPTPTESVSPEPTPPQNSAPNGSVAPTLTGQEPVPVG